MSIILFPFSLIYGVLIKIWDIYWNYRKPVRVPARMISIGNITAGGSGKTSIAGFVAQESIRCGHKTAIVARGYKRLHDRPVAISSKDEVSWRECGDEPLALVRSIPELTVYVDSDKTSGAKRAAADGYEIIIIDDGFQHRGLYRDADIVCLDGHDPFGNNMLLPAGKLREPKKSLKRADIIIIVDYQRSQASDLPKNIPVFHAAKIPSAMKNLNGRRIDIHNKKVIGFCGLGNPESFRQSLMSTGCFVSDFIKFSDHHIYNEADITRIKRQMAENGCDAAVTTLKDMVKLDDIWPENLQLCYLEITIELDKKGEFFKLLNLL